MSDLLDKDLVLDTIKRICIEVLEECDSHYDCDICDYVYDDTKEVNAILRVNKAIRAAINNMESEHELINRDDAIKSITQYNGVVDKSVAKRILTQLDPADVNAVSQQKIGEWNMFILLSSAWYGKECYFEQDNYTGIIYSRLSGKTMSREDAVKEFIREISE